MLNLQGQPGSHSVQGLMGATPCCHTQLTPVMWPFGSAVRVLDTALRSRRSAALLVTPPSIHPSLPPSTSISTSTSAPKPLDHKRREREDRPSASAIVNRGTPSPLHTPRQTFRLAKETRSASGGAYRSSQPHTAALCRSVPGRSSSPLEDSLFPGSWMNYWRVVNKCEKKAEARDLPPRSVQGRRDSARVVEDNGGDVPVCSCCDFTDAM